MNTPHEQLAVEVRRGPEAPGHGWPRLRTSAGTLAAAAVGR
jgi:hypothetical protein